MTAITTSATITELVPNPGEKEIIIETPLLMRGGLDRIEINLSEYDIAPEGVISIKGYMLSATYGIITTNEPVTSINSGTLIISSTVAVVYPAKQLYRVVGTSL